MTSDNKHDKNKDMIKVPDEEEDSDKLKPPKLLLSSP